MRQRNSRPWSSRRSSGATQKAAPDQILEVFAAELAARDPGDRVYVPQSARTAFDVRFQVMDGVVVAMMAGLLFAELAFEKVARWPDVFRGNRSLHVLQQFFGSEQQAGFHQRGEDGEVLCRILSALLRRCARCAGSRCRHPTAGSENPTGRRGPGRRFLPASGPAGRHPSRGAVRRGRSRRLPPVRSRHGLCPCSRARRRR